MANRIFEYTNDVSFNRSARIRRSISNSGYVRQEQGSPSYFNLECTLKPLVRAEFNQVEAELLTLDDGLGIPVSELNQHFDIVKFEGTLTGGSISTEGTGGRTVRLTGTSPLDATVVAGDFIQFGGNNKVYQVRSDAAAVNGVIDIPLHTGAINTLNSQSATFDAVNPRTTTFTFTPATVTQTLLDPDSVPGAARFAVGSSARVGSDFRLINSSGTNRNRWSFIWGGNDDALRAAITATNRFTLVDASNRLGLTIRTAFGKDDNQPNRLVSYINQSETRSPANDFSAWGTSGTIFVDGETEGASNALTYNGAPVTGTQTFTANIARRSNSVVWLNNFMINGQPATAEEASSRLPRSGDTVRIFDPTRSNNYGYTINGVETDGGEQRIRLTIGNRSPVAGAGFSVEINVQTLTFTLDRDDYTWNNEDHVRVVRTYLFNPGDQDTQFQLSNIRAIDHQTGNEVPLNTQDLFREFGFYSTASGNGTGSNAVPILASASGSINFETTADNVTIPTVTISGQNTAQAIANRIQTVLLPTDGTTVYLAMNPVINGNMITLTWTSDAGNAGLATTNGFVPTITGQTFVLLSATGGPQQFRTGQDCRFQFLMNGRPSVTVIPGPGYNYYQYDTFNFTEVLTNGTTTEIDNG